MSDAKKFADISAYPLQWPDGWVRTKPQHRKPNSNWKGTFGVYRSGLFDELRRLTARSVLSTNIPLNKTNGLPRENFEPIDPGVAVYFTRRSAPDTRWQDVLEFPDDWRTRLFAAQALELVEKNFRRLAVKCHPDTHPKEAELFYRLNTAKQQAIETIMNREPSHEYAMACDKFNSVRLNLHAIALTINSMRQMERCGTSLLMERAFRGFQRALPARASEEGAA